MLQYLEIKQFLSNAVYIGFLCTERNKTQVCYAQGLQPPLASFQPIDYIVSCKRNQLRNIIN